MSLRPPRLAATYSIVARDRATGELGVAVQSNYFSVGTAVSWATPGVGAIATQAMVEVSYGPRGLELLAEGRPAPEVLERLVARDSGSALRQVAIVDAAGRVAAHTGSACVPLLGQHSGEGYSVQGNMLRSDAVWQVMGPTFERCQGDLAERLLATLEAAEDAGGDVRGRQSAALLVVSGERPGHPWEGRRVDLHVEHHPQPLQELRRLLTIRRAHDLFAAAQRDFGRGDLERALERVTAARSLQPDNFEFAFWTGVALANSGRRQDARHWLGEAFAADEAWRELARRLVPLGMFPDDASLLGP